MRAEHRWTSTNESGEHCLGVILQPGDRPHPDPVDLAAVRAGHGYPYCGELSLLIRPDQRVAQLQTKPRGS